ncbi:MAG: EamA/RhaT family transporter [Gemmatimonas sp.]|nr:EamA/RhaT family transporter [Gemmatimonas sp.]
MSSMASPTTAMRKLAEASRRDSRRSRRIEARDEGQETERGGGRGDGTRDEGRNEEGDSCGCSPPSCYSLHSSLRLYLLLVPLNLPSAPQPRHIPSVLFLVLAIALLGISTSGPLARLSEAPPLAIATWRLGFSLLIVAVPLIWTRGWRQWKGLGAKDLGIAVAAGAFLAVHFWSWIASLGMTTVAASVLLVNLHPVAMIAGSALWLGERPTQRQILGTVIGLSGAVVVAWGDFWGMGTVGCTGTDTVGCTGTDTVGCRGRELLGNMLALLGALTVAFYYLSARKLRAKLDVWPYVTLVYGTCFVVLLGFSTLTGVQLAPQPPRELTIFAAIALGPMLLGHTGFNWALKHVNAPTVSLVMLGEPVGAGIIAFLVPAIAEVPSVRTFVGGAVILSGIVIATLSPRARSS